MIKLRPFFLSPCRLVSLYPCHNLALSLVIILWITGCNPDDDQNFTATRDTYVGLWHTEIYENGTLDAVYDMEIFAHPSESSRILIDDFNQFGKGYRAEAVVNNTQIDIFQQNVGTYIVSGFGTLKNEGKVLDLNYRVDEQTGQSVKEYTANMTKK